MVRGRCELVVAIVCSLLFAAGAAATEPSTDGVKPSAQAGKRPDQMDFFQSLSLGSRNEPINISSDSLELDYKGSVLTYRGNVQVKQGDVTLTSDRLSITYDRESVQKVPGATPAPTAAGSRGDADKIKEVVAEGNVRIRRGDRLAEGRRAVFDQGKQTIVLSDGAVLHEGPNKVAGDRIVVYLQEERSVVESGSNSRVSAVFYPGTSATAKEER
jgi:lipopolysaccharide export system protein LptA